MGKEPLSFESLHAPYRCDESPSPQAQIRWLLKQGFNPAIVDEAMLTVYEELRLGKTFVNGFLLDQYLLMKARELQQKELNDHVLKLEKFYLDMRDKWTQELNAEKPKPWYKRIFGA